MCPNSWRTASSSSSSLSTVTAISETITSGLRIPTRIKGGAPSEALVVGAILLATQLADDRHRVTARFVLVWAHSIRNKPVPRNHKGKQPRKKVPRSPVKEFPLSKQKEGKVKNTVTHTEKAKGKIRS